eukprot:scaffold770_cov109-Cylindrotheca_fusiformis.AAC.4
MDLRTTARAKPLLHYKDDIVIDEDVFDIPPQSTSDFTAGYSYDFSECGDIMLSFQQEDDVYFDAKEEEKHMPRRKSTGALEQLFAPAASISDGRTRKTTKPRKEGTGLSDSVNSSRPSDQSLSMQLEYQRRQKKGSNERIQNLELGNSIRRTSMSPGRGKRGSPKSRKSAKKNGETPSERSSRGRNAYDDGKKRKGKELSSIDHIGQEWTTDEVVHGDQEVLSPSRRPKSTKSVEKRVGHNLSSSEHDGRDCTTNTDAVIRKSGLLSLSKHRRRRSSSKCDKKRKKSDRRRSSSENGGRRCNTEDANQESDLLTPSRRRQSSNSGKKTGSTSRRTSSFEHRGHRRSNSWWNLDDAASNKEVVKLTMSEHGHRSKSLKGHDRSSKMDKVKSGLSSSSEHRQSSRMGGRNSTPPSPEHQRSSSKSFRSRKKVYRESTSTSSLFSASDHSWTRRSPRGGKTVAKSNKDILLSIASPSGHRTRQKTPKMRKENCKKIEPPQDSPNGSFASFEDGVDDVWKAPIEEYTISAWILVSSSRSLQIWFFAESLKGSASYQYMSQQL